ncbi:MAG: hypothetical protein OES46_05900 [Gammaproteobacteria bacterium]|jgi:hypothetical protein|nr:hypothetical protein [Gammaproteobacteria bacterium]
MSRLSISELQEMAHQTFGRNLSEGEIEVYRTRLPAMVQTVTMLEEWESRLEDTVPAIVHVTPIVHTDDRE